MMKRGFGKGFFSGVLVAALTVGLGVSAMAASRTITVDDNIRITLNGATFSPKDVNGKEVPLFSYNGTTYAPVRAICEAAGLKVDFDSASYTAVLTTQDRYIASTPSASNYITADEAKQAALKHAGVKESDAIFVKAGLDWDDGRVCYEVEFYAGSTEYDYDIDANTGAVLSYDQEWDDFSLVRPGPGTGNTGTNGSTGSAAITEARAKEIALNDAGLTSGQVSFVFSKLDWDDGRWVYEVEFYNSSNYTEYDYEIDANTGAIVSRDFDAEYYAPSNTGSTSTANLITEARAKEIALAKAPSGATVVRCKLDWDDGRYVYEIKMISGTMEYECDVNATTGAITGWDVDSIYD